MEYRDVILKSEKALTEEFLKTFNLKLEQDVEYTINCFDGDKLVGTISTSANIIKCMAVDPSYQGENIALGLVSKATQYLYSKNQANAFVFTKPENKSIFSSMGFKEIITTTNTCVMELHSDITVELEKLKKQHNLNGSYAAIVVNCNPMTNGHLYLISECAKENKQVLVFVVMEDKSYFKYQDRFAVVKAECVQFENVTVLPSTEYIISSKTLPTYFLKDDVDIDNEGMEIDLKIFAKYFIPIFNIDVRYVGTEPFNVFTENYNQAMKRLLPNVKEIERVKDNSLYISATNVRELIQNKDLAAIKAIVPESTYQLIIEKYLQN